MIAGADWTVEFDRSTGYLCRYEVSGMSYLTDDGAVRPNFWRAPVDNDFGSHINVQYSVWRNPELRLKSLDAVVENSVAVVSAEYEIPDVGASLSVRYELGGDASVLVRQSMKAGAVQAPDLFRFGMRMQMDGRFDRICYYGRGPVENYADRNSSAFVGVYEQTVDEQFYGYIRPQETGTKSDVRWWRQCDRGHHGLEFISSAPMFVSALHYTVEDLDDGESKHQRHPADITPGKDVNICIDQYQMGLGCIDSWHSLPMERYRLHYGDYSMTYIIRPLR